jgi:phosphonate transport system ATP-binding protein
MLELTNVTRRFGANTAVDAVTLSIPEGQMVGVIGRSGAGKSTLLRMINRLTAPAAARSASRARRSRADRRELRNWQRDCAMIFQQFNLVPRLDVLTNVLLGHSTTARRCSTFSMSSPSKTSARFGAGAAWHCPDACKWPRRLSGGQQQRVAIARALMQSPSMILADEPIASLDPLNAQIVMDALKDINAAGRHHGDDQPAYARHRARLLRAGDRHGRRQGGV